MPDLDPDPELEFEIPFPPDQPGGVFRRIARAELVRTRHWELLFRECVDAGVVEATLDRARPSTG